MNKKRVVNKSLLIILLLSLLFLGSLSLNILQLIKYSNYVNNDNMKNIVFFGDSLTAGYDISKFFSNEYVVNSGINGNKTEDLIKRINEDLYSYNPSKVFLLIGINDLTKGNDAEDVLSNIKFIINDIKDNRGNAKIYVQSLYPVNEEVVKDHSNENIRKLKNEQVLKLNKNLRKLCNDENVIYINVYDQLIDKTGNLKKSYTTDGLHLTNLGYLKVTSVLKKYI